MGTIPKRVPKVKKNLKGKQLRVINEKIVYLLEEAKNVWAFKRHLNLAKLGGVVKDAESHEEMELKNSDVVLVRGKGKKKDGQLIKNLQPKAKSLRVMKFDPAEAAGMTETKARLDIGVQLHPNLSINHGLKWLPNALENLMTPFWKFENRFFPKLKYLMRPWLEEASLTLIASLPGVGKTWLGDEIAAAVANGRNAMNGEWKVSQKWRTLIVDGEMTPQMIQERGGMARLGECIVWPKVLLEIEGVKPSLDLAKEACREWISEQLERHEVKLLILDNLYSLVSGINLDRAEDWEPINHWLLKLRAMGVAVIMFHHTTKMGVSQLGTGSREFNVNTYLILHEVKTAADKENCAFTIEVRKQRGKDLELAGKIYKCVDGEWTVTKIKKTDEKEIRDAKIAIKLVKGEKAKDVGEEFGFKTEGRISQIKKELIERGLLEKAGKEIVFTAKGKEWAKKYDEESEQNFSGEDN